LAETGLGPQRKNAGMYRARFLSCHASLVTFFLQTVKRGVCRGDRISTQNLVIA
jgi:hypothetical protein